MPNIQVKKSFFKKIRRQKPLLAAMPERKSKMKDDPFGNLMDWGPVLDKLVELSSNGDLSRCQPGLVRILRYRGNWRLREEALKAAGDVQNPSEELVHQVISILDDDNIYYDARILAGDALLQLLNNAEDVSGGDLQNKTRNVVDKLKTTPQPPFFEEAIKRLHSKLVAPAMLEN